MINLLPPEEKIKLLQENQKKMIIILGVTLIVPLLCLILVLLSVRFYLLGEVNFQKIISEQVKKEYQTPDFLRFKEIMQNNGRVLANLHSFYKRETYATEALNIFSSIARPQNLYFTDILLTRNENQTFKVTASGFAKSRDDLLVFQKNINEKSEVKNINFSPESWVSPKDLTFNLTYDIFTTPQK